MNRSLMAFKKAGEVIAAGYKFHEPDETKKALIRSPASVTSGLLWEQKSVVSGVSDWSMVPGRERLCQKLSPKPDRPFDRRRNQQVLQLVNEAAGTSGSEFSLPLQSQQDTFNLPAIVLLAGHIISIHL